MRCQAPAWTDPLACPSAGRDLDRPREALKLVRRRMTELGRDDFFAGGNIFVYYSPEQTRAVAEEERQQAVRE
ncbi:MAG: hypothetical protein GY856_20540, partial [bacterium]|nr:hypothetical protein [bacterium]